MRAAPLVCGHRGSLGNRREVLVLGHRLPADTPCSASVKVAIDDEGTLSYWYRVNASAGEFAEFLDADGCYDEFNGESVMIDSAYAMPGGTWSA